MSSLAPLAREFNARPPGYCSAARALTINRLQQPATQASNDASAVPDFAASCPAFTMAFQPIVDVDKGEVYAHEALVRGIHGEGAGHILGLVHARHRVEFDRACRAKAIELAAGLRMANPSAADRPPPIIPALASADFSPPACASKHRR